MSKGIRVKRMFSGNSGHQILQGRVNNVWLESPNDKIPGHVFLVCTMYGREKSREPSVSDYHKPLVVLSLIDSLKNNRFAVFSRAQHQTREGILPAQPDEKVFYRLVQFFDTSDIPCRSLHRCGQALDHQSAQVIFHHDILEITVKLRDGGSCTGHRHQLSGMLG